MISCYSPYFRSAHQTIILFILFTFTIFTTMRGEGKYKDFIFTTYKVKQNNITIAECRRFKNVFLLTYMRCRVARIYRILTCFHTILIQAIIPIIFSARQTIYQHSWHLLYGISNMNVDMIWYLSPALVVLRSFQ